MQDLLQPPSLRCGPWGETVVTGDPDVIALNPFTYNGRDGVMWDQQTGMYWMRARHYKPDQGRFMQVDPVPAQEGTADTMYNYASADPVNQIDPHGTTAIAVSLISKNTIKVPNKVVYKSRAGIKTVLGLNHIWLYHTYWSHPGKRSYFNQYLSTRKPRLKYLLRTCLTVFSTYRVAGSNAVGYCRSQSVGFTKRDRPTSLFLVSVDLNRRVVTNAWPFGSISEDEHADLKERVAVGTSHRVSAPSPNEIPITPPPKPDGVLPITP